MRAVGASNVLLYRYDEGGVVHGVAGTLAAAIPSYARELFEEDPVQRHLLEIGAHPPVVLTIHAMDRRGFQKSAAYTDFYRPHDMEHLLGMWLTDLPYGAPGMAGILFTRAPGEPDFAEREARVLAQVVPSFQAAARRARRFERASAERIALGALVSAVAPGAHLAFDLEGRPLWISAEAEALLAAPARRGAALPPAPLVEAAARVGALAWGDAASPPRPPSPSALPLPDEGRDPRRLSHLRPRAERPSAWSSPRSRRRPATPRPDPDRGARGGAAPDEARRGRRAGLASAEGLSNKAIAERLFVSIETVKTHVQRILAKLGVASEDPGGRGPGDPRADVGTATEGPAGGPSGGREGNAGSRGVPPARPGPCGVPSRPQEAPPARPPTAGPAESLFRGTRAAPPPA